ncbi:MAG: hypothetical protein AB1847_09260 [bacterium]
MSRIPFDGMPIDEMPFGEMPSREAPSGEIFSDDMSLDEMVNDLQNIYQSDPSGSEALIEKYLEEKLAGILPGGRLPLIEKLAQTLESKTSEAPGVPPSGLSGSGCMGSLEHAKLLSFLLGKDVAGEDFSLAGLLAEMTSSLKAIHGTLNRITDTINTTLLGRRTDMDSIRQIIGSTFEDPKPSTSLKERLDRINDAFLIARQAFRQAVQARLGEILFELNPDRLESTTSGGLRFGPLRKAELFEIYKEKYQTCQRWFESGHLMEEILREFERACQKIYSEKGVEG